MRPIDADALKTDLTRFYDGVVTAKQLIDEQPTIQSDEPSAHLLTLEETIGGDECWIEGRGRACGYGDALLTDDAELVDFYRPHSILTLSFYEYGVTWRCWSHKPTDEQRKAVAWE